MTTDAAAMERRYARRAIASTVFQPTVPINRLELFRGRDEQIEMALEAISQLGQHPVIYGERGVGKSSLASVLGEILQRANIAGWKLSFVNCSKDDTFESLWRAAFENLIVTDNDIVLPEGPRDSLDLPTRLVEWLGGDITPSNIVRVARLAQGHLIVIFDEFDQLVGRGDISEPMANTIKALSDRHVRVTLVMVGVADSIDALLDEHLSTERNLSQIKMPRMSHDEIDLIVRGGLAALDITVEDDAMRYLHAVVQGLPSPAHRIGLHCAYILIDEERNLCTKADVKRALETVAKQMSEGLLKSWDDATNSPRKDALFDQVLIACALTRRGNLGWLSPADVLEPFQVITGRKDYGISTYSQHLHLLADGRGHVLEKQLRESRTKRYRFRFRSPLFQAFVVMHALTTGLLDEATLQAFEENLPR